MRSPARLLRRPEAALFVLILAAYSYFYQAGGWNQNSRFDLTRAIVEDGSSKIDRFRKNTGDLARRGDHYYCEKAPAVSWLGVPAYASVHALAGPPDRDDIDRAAYLTTLWAVALPSALAVLALAFLLGALGLSAPVRIGGAAAYGLATLAFPYSTLFYGEQLCAALLLFGSALLVQAERSGQRPARLFAAGLLLGAAVLADFPAVLAVAPLTIYAGMRLRTWPMLVCFLAGGAVMAAVLLIHNAVVFGGPFTLPYEYSLMRYRHEGVFMGIGAPSATALWHITLSSYRGLLFSAPWLLLALPGAVRLIRRPDTRPLAIVCATIAVLFLCMNMSLVDPLGGWGMGPRFLSPALPFWAVLACGVFLPAERPVRPLLRRAVIAVSAAAALYSAALMLIGTAVKPEVDIAIRHPFGDYLVPRFVRGELSVSTQGIDMVNLPRNAPEKAWNLGELVGLPGLWSLLPLALIAAGCVAWLVLIERRAERGASS